MYLRSLHFFAIAVSNRSSWTAERIALLKDIKKVRQLEKYEESRSVPGRVEKKNVYRMIRNTGILKFEILLLFVKRCFVVVTSSVRTV